MDIQGLLAMVIQGNNALAKGNSKLAKLDFQPARLSNPFFECKPLAFRDGINKTTFDSFDGWIEYLIQHSAESLQILASGHSYNCGIKVNFKGNKWEAWLGRHASDPYGYGTLIEDPELDQFPNDLEFSLFIRRTSFSLNACFYDQGTFEELCDEVLSNFSLPDDDRKRMLNIVYKLLPMDHQAFKNHHLEAIAIGLLHLPKREILTNNQVQLIMQLFYSVIMPK